MWAKVESGSVTKIYTRPTQVTIGNTQYPRNIFELWTSSELEAIGIYEVEEDNTNLKDQGYYFNTNQSFTFASGKVTATYGTATAMSLNDTGSGETLVRGLKYRYKADINNQAASLLSNHDWMSIREAEGGTDMPSDIKTWRASVRTKANSMCTQIDNASDVDALKALYTYNTATPPVRPLGEFPAEPS